MEETAVEGASILVTLLVWIIVTLLVWIIVSGLAGWLASGAANLGPASPS